MKVGVAAERMQLTTISLQRHINLPQSNQWQNIEFILDKKSRTPLLTNWTSGIYQGFSTISDITQEM